MVRQIIVLGGNGFLGTNLCEALYRKGIKPIVLDKALGCNLAECSGQSIFKDVIDSASSIDGSVDIVMMAANLGAKLFETSPIAPYKENKQINERCIDTMLSSGKELHISFYSTSEVYGNVDPQNVPKALVPTFDSTYGRSLYAQEKLLTETLLNSLRQSGSISSLRVFRPFNISGCWQQRGVVYEMLKSALQQKRIYYAYGQTREITSVEDATTIAIEAILARRACEGTFDLASKDHIYLKDLAFCIKDLLVEIDSMQWSNVDVEEAPPTSAYIQTRGTVNVLTSKQDLEDFKTRLRTIVKSMLK